MVFVIDAQVAGVSGDMLLSSLVNIGANRSKIIDGIRSAESLCKDVKIKKIDFVEVKKNSLQATELLLEIDDDVHERKGIEIKEIIEKSTEKLTISESAKTFAIKSIETLIRAESKLHGEPEDSVHFHEAASFDTVVDLLGTAIALDDLGCFDDDIVVTPVAIGGGTVTFSHGTSSNPAYAILEIFRESGIITVGGNVKEELTTPTGASMLVNLIKECSEFYPPMKIQSIGYGAGQKDFEGFSNVLKIVRGIASTKLQLDTVKILETNVDDVSGEVLGNMIEKIMAQGAKDVTISSAITKKGRPTNLVSVICDSDTMNSIMDLLVTETGTLGVRIRTSERYIVPRSVKIVSVNIQGQSFDVRYKTRDLSNGSHFKIESDDIREISSALSISFKDTEELLNQEVRKEI
ncbi:nickel pincer cofactor biosynthesis protein LarC [Marine Group I thaumarchaeote]|uniref:Nickel pincer cofactor biosynthesis protein LarC n=1 Tax=Marine Group I thaumarchaeote TaxID=2511932 RepID=A0A7K4NTZ1_9ARCH|nr:nickel pincer cofactor biosynthesis protein LarC [Marine Group I thaumarchaeote]